MAAKWVYSKVTSLGEGILILLHRRPIQISSHFLSFKGWEDAIFIERSVFYSTLIFKNQQISMPVVSTFPEKVQV